MYLPHSEMSPAETVDCSFLNNLRDTFPGNTKQPAAIFIRV